MRKLILYLVLLVPLGMYAQHEDAKEPLMTKEEFKEAGDGWFDIALQRSTEKELKSNKNAGVGYELQAIKEQNAVRATQPINSPPIYIRTARPSTTYSSYRVQDANLNSYRIDVTEHRTRDRVDGTIRVSP